MLALFKLKLPEVIRAVAPLVVVVSVLQIAFVGASAAIFLQFLAGAVLAIVGMVLLFAGVDLGVVPMGRFIGAELPRRGSIALIVAVGFGLGLATTVAEPDVLVLAREVARASKQAMGGQLLVYVIATGVGIFTALGFYRIVRGFSMMWLLTVAFGLVLLLSFAAPPVYVPLAYDAGSVTTGVLTTPVVLAVGLGVSSVIAGRAAVSDGFGLLGLASIGPIIVVLLLGILVS